MTVAEKLLDGTDIGSVLEQMSRKGVPHAVALDMLDDACFLCGLANGALHGTGENMVAALDFTAGIDGEIPGREDELPAPFAVGIAVLAGSASASAAGVAVGAFVLAPVLIVGGMIQSKNKDWVAREMVHRYTPLPIDLAPQELQSLTTFFPLAPSPSQIELAYDDTNGAHKLVIDTRELLHGLHIGITDE